MAEKNRPLCPIIGADGNIFNILGMVSRTLRRNGMADEAQEMYNRVTSSGTYEQALCIITEYITPCSQEELEEDSLSQQH